VGFGEKMIALIHLKSPPPTLTLVNYVPIIKFMDTIIVHLAFKTTTKLIAYDQCWEKSRF
jgi:hypothetical protein